MSEFLVVPAILVLTTIGALIWTFVVLHRRSREVTRFGDTSSSQERGSAGKTSTSADQSPQAVIAELRSALALREETIKELREKGVVADCDRWKATAKQLQEEIAGLRTAATSIPSGEGRVK